MEARLSNLQRILVYEPNPSARAQAHFELGQLHADHGRLDPARRHLNEALHLDAAMDGARSLLAQLAPARKAERGFFQKLFRR